MWLERKRRKERLKSGEEQVKVGAEAAREGKMKQEVRTLQRWE